MKTLDAAKGRWLEILPRFGIPADALNGKHQPCPCTGGGTDRFRFADRDGSGSFFCACSQGDKGGLALIMCKTELGYAEVARQVDEIIGNKSGGEATPRPTYYAGKLRAMAETSTRSAYLANRGLEVAPGLEFCRSVEYRHDDGKITRHPAMLAPIVRGGEFLTYHVTYLNRGAKADVPVPKKILPGPELRGAACPLYPAAETMGLAEGVETAIAASMIHGNMPVWAALNTALMKGFDPPPECRHLMIFADNDAHYAGHAAAYALAHRLAGKLDSVTVFMPQKQGQDWCDVLAASREVAA